MNIEDKILFHRYRYYIMCDPLISDFEYDMLDKEAVAILPPDSVVNQPGSDLKSSYPAHIAEMAELHP